MAAICHTEGKEMVNIQGCYMYMINNAGKVGAFLGFKTMTLIVPLCREDAHKTHAFLRCYRWFYPLARSFSPIYVWGPDKIIFPEPFSALKKPNYVVVRLPYEMSQYQKSTLWNLLDMFAHLRGKFQTITPEERKAQERKYFLTEIFPYDEVKLNLAPPNHNAPDIKVLKPLTYPELSYKGKPYVEAPVYLSVALHNTKKCCLPMEHKAVVNPIKCCYLQDKCDPKRSSIVPPSNIREMPKTAPPRSKKEQITAGGLEHYWVSLPDHYGNIIRQYMIGPRDPQHIKITFIPMAVGMSEIVYRAVKKVYREQIRLRDEKEHAGIPPSFEQRKQRLLCGFGGAPELNEFGAALSSNKPNNLYKNELPIDFGMDATFEEALNIQNLEVAAGLFDQAIRHGKILLLSCDPDEVEVNAMHKEDLTLALIPRPIHVRYHKSDALFGHLMTLSACIENEIIYKKTTNYFERVNEDCEHHYPKIRPRNPYLDPAYVYSRYAPKYHVPAK